MEQRKRAGIVNIVIGSLMTAFFLFGLGIAWLLPALIADPGKIIDILSGLSAGEFVLLGLVAFLFFFGLFTIYRGVSLVTGFSLSEESPAFIRKAGDVLRSLRRRIGIPKEGDRTSDDTAPAMRKGFGVGKKNQENGTDR